MDLDTESGWTMMAGSTALHSSTNGARRFCNSPMYFFSNSPVKWRYKGRVDQHTIESIHNANSAMTYLDEGSFARSAVANYIQTRHIVFERHGGANWEP